VIEFESQTQKSRSLWDDSRAIHFKVTPFSRQWINRPHLWRPPTDLFENEEAFVVRVEIAGMQDAELNIANDGNVLAIHGLREHAPERAAYHQMEVRFGEFLSLVELPGPADMDATTAHYEDGFLLVTVPKAGR